MGYASGETHGWAFLGHLYGRLKNVPLAVSRETGALLHMLARTSRARTIVEFGTSSGISTLYLAAALRVEGDGPVYGLFSLYLPAFSLISSRRRRGRLA